jgi:hypothetical protein
MATAGSGRSQRISHSTRPIDELAKPRRAAIKREPQQPELRPLMLASSLKYLAGSRIAVE